MNNKTIEINTTMVRTKITLLKTEKEKIDKVLENFKGGTLRINDFWQGDTGDEVSEWLIEYITTFDYISSRLAGFIAYLEKVCNLYEREDDKTNKAIEELLAGLPSKKGTEINYEYIEK